MCGFEIYKNNGLYLFYTYLKEEEEVGRERKYPKHDNRESAENETIEMRIKIHLTTGIAAKLLLRLRLFFHHHHHHHNDENAQYRTLSLY